MSTAFAYESKIIREKEIGNKLPTFHEIIKDIIINSSTELKTEEIISRTSNKIGLPVDHSLQEKIANILLKLEKENTVYHVRRGYWIKK